MLYCSPRVLDSTLVQTILPIINDDNYSLDYQKNIEKDQSAEIIKKVGFQNKHANDLK